MLDALRFVASAVAKKDFVPELTHFKIKDGRVTGFNGQVALSSPIDVDLDVQPNAQSLIAAVRACKGTIALHMTPAGRLAVKSEKFKAFVPCLPDEAAMFVAPEGEEVELGDNFMSGVKAIAPIMGVDASRPWAMGIKLSAGSMFATNNVMLVEYWHGTNIPLDVVIPSAAINELLRIDETPTRVQVTENSLSFWFGPDRWMRTQLVLGGAWPTDRMSEIMSLSNGEMNAVSPGFFEAIDTLKPFLGETGSIFLTSSHAMTSPADGDGASVEIELPIDGMQRYHHRQLALLGEVATEIDWSGYPRPCKFTNGARLRGALVGQKL